MRAAMGQKRTPGTRHTATALLATAIGLAGCQGGISLGVSATSDGGSDGAVAEAATDATQEGAPEGSSDAPSAEAVAEVGSSDADASMTPDATEAGIDFAAEKQGTVCSSTSTCPTGLCLPISAYRSACTVACASSSDCLPGWTCNPVGGKSTKACQCVVDSEVCDGKDNDCNGVVDDLGVTDPWCDWTVGAGFVCRSGTCACGSLCGVSCVNTTSDPANCGSCGNACDTGANCLFGTCGGKTAIAIDAYGSTCAVLSDGRLACWGDITGTFYGHSTVPVAVPNLPGAVKAISTGYYASCALIAGGTVVCWGTDSQGQLNGQAMFDPSIPVAILSGAIAVSTGLDHTCAVLSDGTVRCWGSNLSGALGNGTTNPSKAIETVKNITGAVAISGSGSTTCALLSDATVTCWGQNPYGEAGNGTQESLSTPVAISGLSGVAAISVGGNHGCAVLSDGTMKCWGDDSHGQLGDGTTMLTSAPVVKGLVAVTGLTGAVGVSTNGNSTCALLSSGTIRCWGAGPLGDGVTNQTSSPIAVPGLTGVTAVSGKGNGGACVLLTNGSVQCWGDNLGGGTLNSSDTPVQVHL
jgi:hypothetical protein